MFVSDRDVEPGREYGYRVVVHFDVGTDIVRTVRVRSLWPTRLERPVELENGKVRVRYTLTERAQVRLAIYDVRGRLVDVLDEGLRDPGEHQVVWQRFTKKGLQTRRGVYFLSWRAGARSASHKIVVVHY